MDEYWSLLPEELQVDILSRVPAKTLARFRSTSKEFNALLQSGTIANNKAPKELESLIIMLKDLRVYLVRISLHRKKVKVASEFYLKDPLSDSSQVDIRSVFHCDGLLLCATEDKRLVVWNPCTGETKWIKPRTSYKESDCYALGYDKDKHYKVLRVDRQDDVIPIKYVCEIYDFTSESWRLVGVATNWFLPLYSRGLSVKGLTYWVATMVRKTSGDFLLRFDFETERFLRLSLPHPFPYSIAALSVVRDEQLCVLGINHKFWMEDAAACPNDLQVWVTTSTGSAMSWSKSLGLRRSKYLFSNWMSFLADEQDKVVLCLKSKNILEVLGEKKQILEEHLGGDSTCLSSCSVLMNYVPALAQIQQGALLRGRKRKAPSK